MTTCPKCGSDAGWSGPKFERQEFLPLPYGGVFQEAAEWLGFACLTCGYKRREPTKDAAPLPLLPPRPPQDMDPGREIRDGGDWWVVGAYMAMGAFVFLIAWYFA